LSLTATFNHGGQPGREPPHHHIGVEMDELERVAQMVADGRITAEEGDRLIAVLRSVQATSEELDETTAHLEDAVPAEPAPPLPPLPAAPPRAPLPPLGPTAAVPEAAAVGSP